MKIIIAAVVVVVVEMVVEWLAAIHQVQAQHYLLMLLLLLACVVAVAGDIPWQLTQTKVIIIVDIINTDVLCEKWIEDIRLCEELKIAVVVQKRWECHCLRHPIIREQRQQRKVMKEEQKSALSEDMYI